ncbi:MAG: hypothetical protein AAGJ81_06475 [Verrucomicrobiota bacterium]
MGSPSSSGRVRYAWISDDDDPTLHACLEEACLRDSEEDYLLVYINRPSLHVGKNQNLWAQVSAKEVFESNVSLHRRITGGGTVYHDFGNLNYALISTGEPRVDFCRHLHFLFPYFEARKLSVEIRNRSDLFKGEGKFSGNAEYFSGRRILHHGTLLFKSDLNRLHSLLTPSSSAYRDRSIDSNRNRTINLSTFLPKLSDTRSFAEDFVATLQDFHPCLTLLDKPPIALKTANEKYGERFKSNGWIYGRSPKYELRKTVKSSFGEVSSLLVVREGKIMSARFKCDDKQWDESFQRLAIDLGDKLHAPSEISKCLPKNENADRFSSLLSDHWLDLLF